MAYLTSDNMPLPVAREALYPSGTTGTIPSGNTSTGFSIPLGSLELSGSTSLFDAQIATIVIANTGTAQTINATTLTFSDSIGAQTPAISYALSGVSVASGTSAPFTISLNNGILKNASVIITFASAPVAGSATIQATLQSGGGSSGGGGGSSDITVHDNNTPSYHLKINSDGSINTSGGGGTSSSVAINDGTTTSQHATIDGSGNLHVTDAKVPATGQATMTNSLPVVIASNQTAIPISGSITASNASIGTDGSAIPTSSTLIGASDGTNLQHLLVESASNRNLRTALYSGANEATVTGANALKTDGSAVTQPVSGTVTANAGTNMSTAALALESGNLATTATQTANASTVLGGTSDAGVLGDVVGSISAKLRGLSKIFNLIFDSTNNWVNVQLASLIAGEDIPNNVLKTESRFTPVTLSSSGVVKGVSARFAGFICTASSSGVVEFWDNATTSSGTPALSSMAVTAGQIVAVPNGCALTVNGLFFQLVSGTATLTIYYN